MKEIKLFNDQLVVHVSDEDWNFMCENRFFTTEPEYDLIKAEFSVGTGITSEKKHLWGSASKLFSEYIQELKEIQSMDINFMARNLLTNEEKYGETQ